MHPTPDTDSPSAIYADLDAIRVRLQNLRDPSLTGGIDYSTRQVSLAITKVEEAQHWLGYTIPPTAPGEAAEAQQPEQA